MDQLRQQLMQQMVDQMSSAVQNMSPEDMARHEALRYLRARRKEGFISVIAGFSFLGIMLGVAFVLLNNVVGHLGLLHAWTPWLAASMPSLLFLTLSLTAFGWLVRYR